MIAVQSFDDMRVHELALGRATGGAVSNGIMVSVNCYFTYTVNLHIFTPALFFTVYVNETNSLI